MFWKHLSFFFLLLMKVGHESCAQQTAGDGRDHHICRKTEWDCDRRGNNKVVFPLKLMHVPPHLVLLIQKFCLVLLLAWRNVFCGGRLLTFHCCSCCYKIIKGFLRVFFLLFVSLAEHLWKHDISSMFLNCCLLSHSSERKHVLARK